MRIKYTGKDKRIRIAEVNRLKFLPDGFQSTDPRNERDEDVQGSLVVFHTDHARGGKRTTLKLPNNFDFDSIQKYLLETGWADLSMYPAVSEFFY